YIDDQLRIPNQRLEPGRPPRIPDVFTDVNAHAFVAKHYHRAAVAGLKVALFVKDAIVGQEILVIALDEFAPRHHRGRVVDIGSVGINEAEYYHDPVGGFYDALERAIEASNGI